MSTKTSYTEEQTIELVKLYKDGLTIEELAERLSRTIPSVRSKLVKEGVYLKPVKQSTKKTGPGKKELVRKLEKLTNINFISLTGANKVDLMNLVTFVESKLQDESTSNNFG